MIWIPISIMVLGFFSLISFKNAVSVLFGGMLINGSLALIFCISGTDTGSTLRGQIIALIIWIAGVAQTLVGHALISEEEDNQ